MDEKEVISVEVESKGHHQNKINNCHSIDIAMLIPWRRRVVYTLKCESHFEDMRLLALIFLKNRQELGQNERH